MYRAVRFLAAIFAINCLVALPAAQAKSQSIHWADLVESRIYKTDREFSLSSAESSLVIKAGTEMRLADFKPLPMINVFLAEFKVIDCKDDSFASDMIIVEIDQPSAQAVAVGVDMAEKCVLEVFLENKDYYALSMFK